MLWSCLFFGDDTNFQFSSYLKALFEIRQTVLRLHIENRSAFAERPSKNNCIN